MSNLKESNSDTNVVERNEQGYLDSWPEKDTKIEDEEIKCAEKMINDFKMYVSHIRCCLEQERRAISKLPAADRELLGDPRQHWTNVAACAVANQKILENAITFAQVALGPDNPIVLASQIHQPRLPDDDRMSKVRSLFKQMTRDWSSEGAEERVSCYSRVIRGLVERFPTKNQRHEIQVLVPGSGLSRLAWDISRLGFSTLANEFDFSMIVMANYLLNSKLKVDQIRKVTVPDIDMSSNQLLTRENTFSFAMGDFLEVFSDGEQFDAVVSVFFLDTAKNPVAYIRAMYNLLKPGGVWINFGPLLYHYADMPENDSVEIPFDKLLEIIEKIGFQIVKKEGKGENPPAFYTRNLNSMLSYSYDCGMVAGLFEESRVYNIEATAIDKTPNSHFVVAAGYHNAYIFNTASLESFQEVKIRNKFVSKLVCHPSNHTSQVAIVSGSEVGIYTLDTLKQKVRWKLTSASSKYISDISWNHFNTNLLATCANYDITIIRDLRVPKKVAIELGNSSGATGSSQVEYSPMMENILATCSMGNVNLWDQRQPRSALTEFQAHSSLITCLAWHPNNKHSFLTSAKDNLLRCWDFFDDDGEKVEQPDVHERDLDCWRFWFAPDGEEYAMIKSPLSSTQQGHLAVYQYPFQENLNPLKIDTSDLFIDLCWDKNPDKPSKFVWALSKNKGLVRHAIVFDYSSENREEMATPIAQSAMDEAMDLQAFVESRPEIINEKAIGGYSSGSEFGSPDKGGHIIGHMDMEDHRQNPGGQHFSPSSSWNEKEQSPIKMSPSTTSITSVIAQMYLTRQTSSNAIPISPLPIGSMDYERWIVAPNTTGGDLIDELDALWGIEADGITMTEINRTRAAIGFVYEHPIPTYRKLSFEARYHRSFVDNGKIVIKLLQNNCPLNKENALKLLTLMQNESERQYRLQTRHDREPIFSRVLKNLRNLINSMKVFTFDESSAPNSGPFPSITPPTPSTIFPTMLHNQYHFPNLFHDDRKRPTSTSSIIDETESEGSESSLRQSISISFNLSILDHFVPAPRTSGAQFDSSGYLVRFGNFRSTIRQGFRAETNTATKISTSGGINFKELGIIDVENEGETNVPSSEDEQNNTFLSLIRNKKKAADGSSDSNLSSASSTKSDKEKNYDDEEEDESDKDSNSTKSEKGENKKNIGYIDYGSEPESEEPEPVSESDSFITPPNRRHISTSSDEDASSETSSTTSEDEEEEVEVIQQQPEENDEMPMEDEPTNQLMHHPFRYSSSDDIPTEPIFMRNFEIKDEIPEDPIQSSPSIDEEDEEVEVEESSEDSYRQEFDIGDFPLYEKTESDEDARITNILSLETLRERNYRQNYKESDEIYLSPASSAPSVESYKTSPSASSFTSDEFEDIEEFKKDKQKKNLTSVLLAAPKATMFPFGDVKAAPKSLVDYIEMMGPILREIAQHKRDAANVNNEEGYSPDGYPKGDNLPYHCVSPVRTFSLSSSPTAASIILQRNNPRGRLSSSPGSTRSFAARHRGGSLTLTDPESNVKSSSSDFLVSTPVELFDVSYYLPVSKTMAKNYKLLGANHKKLVKHNIKQINSDNRTDVTQTWGTCKDYVKSIRSTFMKLPREHCKKSKICETAYWGWHRKYDSKYQKNLRIQRVIQRGLQSQYKTPWNAGTLNSNFFIDLLQSHAEQGDVQTVAAVTCAMSDVCRLPPKKRSRNSRSNAWGAILENSEKPNNGMIRSSSDNHNLSGSPLINVMWPPNNNGKSKRSASIGGSAGPLAERSTIHGGLVSTQSTEGKAKDGDNFQFLQKLALRQRARSNSIGNSNDANIFQTEPIFDDDTPLQTDAADDSTPEGDAEQLEDHVMIFDAEDKPYPGEPINLKSVKREFPMITGKAFDHFETSRVEYAEILARWGMFKKSAEVLKFCPSQQPDPFSILIACSQCQQVFDSEDENGDICEKCKQELIICVICDFPCSGLILTCPLCSHGGHLEHMKKWFKEQSICPMGACPCLCPL
uniref:Carnosine N-methyltransferase n=1 Tax=Panagrolaimus sp. PS1159 TaxID=55785 RepID=A0AC35G671_9BILA